MFNLYFFPQAYAYGLQQNYYYCYGLPQVKMEDVNKIEDREAASTKCQEHNRQPRYHECQVESVESSKSYRPNRRFQSKKKQTKSIKIRPQRNAMINIGNQILTFIYLRKKNGEILRKKYPQLNPQQLHRYYAFAKQIKQSMYGYINQEKLRLLWHDKSHDDDLNYQILRFLSYYYLRCLMIHSIIVSKKMNSTVKPIHLAIRRKMLNYLENKSPIIDLRQ